MMHFFRLRRVPRLAQPLRLVLAALVAASTFSVHTADARIVSAGGHAVPPLIGEHGGPPQTERDDEDEAGA